jgi:hypothetical protein
MQECSQAIWRDLQLEHIRVQLEQAISAKQVLESILNLQEDVQSRVVTLLYVWWSERCCIREGDTPRGSTQMVQYIRSYAEEFSVLKRQKPELVQAVPKPRWCRSPNGVVKLKCDGAFSQSSHSGGWGFILRDHEGNVISSGFGKLAKVLEPAHTEIIACLQAVQSAADLGIQNIILESDAAAVVNAVLSMEIDRCSASGLLWELKGLLSCNSAFKKVAHIVIYPALVIQ